MKIILLISMLSLVACATKPLTDHERSVRLLRKSDPPKECKEIGPVVVNGMFSVTEQGIEDDIKRATYKLGADTATLDRTDPNNLRYATAFKCN